MAAFAADEGSEDDPKVQPCLAGLAVEGSRASGSLRGGPPRDSQGLAAPLISQSRLGRGVRLRHLFLRIRVRLQLRCLQRS